MQTDFSKAYKKGTATGSQNVYGFLLSAPISIAAIMDSIPKNVSRGYNPLKLRKNINLKVGQPAPPMIFALMVATYVSASGINTSAKPRISRSIIICFLFILGSPL